MPKTMTIAASVGAGSAIAMMPRRIATSARSANAHQLPLQTSTPSGAVIVLSAEFSVSGSGSGSYAESIDPNYFTHVVRPDDLQCLDEAVLLLDCPYFLRV